MKLTELGIRFDRSVFVLVFAVVLLGVSSYASLPRELFPEIKVPYFIVTADYTGASPETMESLLALPLEREIATVDNVKNITTNLREGSLSIFIEFESDANLSQAKTDLKDALDRAEPDLPDDMESAARVKELNFSRETPVMTLAIDGDLSSFQIKAITDQVGDAIEALPAVLEIEVKGVPEQEFQIVVDAEKLAAYQLSLTSIRQGILDQIHVLPAKNLDLGKGFYSISVPRSYDEPQDLGRIVVGARNGAPIFLTDLATVHLGFKELGSISRVNRQPTSIIEIKMKTGQNIIELSDQVQQIVNYTNDRLPITTQLIVIQDLSTFTRSSVNDLEGTVLIGFLVLVLVLFNFLGLTNSLFVAAAIPLSALASLTILKSLGNTLNQMVLSGLLVSLGMVVDNGIVIVENIYRHRQQGASRSEAVRLAMAEISWPVVSSTATTVAAFLPLAFWGGIFGSFFRPFIMTLILTIISSLLVALIVNPVLCATLMPAPRLSQRREWPAAAVYQKILHKILQHPKLIAVLVLLYFPLSFYTFTALGQGVRLFPDSTPEEIRAIATLPGGINLDAAAAYLTPIEDFLADNYSDQFDSLISTVSRNRAEVLVTLKSAQELTVSYQEIIDALRQRFGATPGYRFTVSASRRGPPGQGGITLKIDSNNIDELTELTAKSKLLLSTIDGVVDIEDNLELSVPEVSVLVDPERAAIQGITNQSIALTISAATKGYTIGSYLYNNEDYDITVRYPHEQDVDINSLASLLISAPGGGQVPLASVADIRLEPSSGNITRADQRRTVTVSADNRGRNVAQIVAEFEQRQNEAGIPSERTSFSGEEEDRQEIVEFMQQAMMVAIVLIWVVLLAQFNSFKYALLVLLAAILPLPGVFLGLGLLRSAFYATFSGIAIVSLAGVAVNNSIVMIDYINRLRKEGGLELREAIIRGCGIRFRPVVLTSITTIVATLPMATGFTFEIRSLSFSLHSATSEIWQPLGQALAAGMGFATLMTLVAIPVLYYLIERPKRKKKKKLEFPEA